MEVQTATAAAPAPAAPAPPCFLNPSFTTISSPLAAPSPHAQGWHPAPTGTTGAVVGCIDPMGNLPRIEEGEAAGPGAHRLTSLLDQLRKTAEPQSAAAVRPLQPTPHHVAERPSQCLLQPLQAPLPPCQPAAKSTQLESEFPTNGQVQAHSPLVTPYRVATSTHPPNVHRAPAPVPAGRGDTRTQQQYQHPGCPRPMAPPAQQLKQPPVQQQQPCWPSQSHVLAPRPAIPRPLPQPTLPSRAVASNQSFPGQQNHAPQTRPPPPGSVPPQRGAQWPTSCGQPCRQSVPSQQQMVSHQNQPLQTRSQPPAAPSPRPFPQGAAPSQSSRALFCAICSEASPLPGSQLCAVCMEMC